MSGRLAGAGVAGPGFLLDLARAGRIGLPEAIYCAGKTPAQIASIVSAAPVPLLLTRLDPARFEALPDAVRRTLDYDPLSATAWSGPPPPAREDTLVGIVSAGTSDLPVAREAARTLRFGGEESVHADDVGVAGLWRLLDRIEALAALPVLVVAAGMDAALASVLGGLVPSAIVAVPTSVGYGVATGGQGALHAMLSSCAPGIAVVNIDNGYGAAAAALRLTAQIRGRRHGTP